MDSLEGGLGVRVAARESAWEIRLSGHTFHVLAHHLIGSGVIQNRPILQHCVR